MRRQQPLKLNGITSLLRVNISFSTAAFHTHENIFIIGVDAVFDLSQCKAVEFVILDLVDAHVAGERVWDPKFICGITVGRKVEVT